MRDEPSSELAVEPRVEEHRPVRSRHLTILSAIAIGGVLYLARGFLLPLIGALLLGCALAPVVTMLRRLHIPRGIAAAMAILAVTSLLVIASVRLAPVVYEWADRLPEGFDKLQALARPLMDSVEQMGEATERLGEISNSDESAQPVVVSLASPGISEILMNQTPIILGGLLSVFILLYFVLAYGHILLGKAVEASSTFRDKRRVVESLRSVVSAVSRYLLTVTVINICLGIALGVILYVLDFETPLVWGAMATILNFVPYLGAVVGVIVLALASVITHSDVLSALLFPAIYLSLTTLEGNFITPMILGKSFVINPIFIVVALLFLGWLWGVAGAIMAVPLLVAAKTITENFDSTRTISTLMSGQRVHRPADSS